MTDYSIQLPDIINGEDKSSPFINCIRNNYRHIRKWAKRTNTNCFRIYDRHLYHIPLAIDFYAGRYCVHYFSPDADAVPDSVVEQVEHALTNTFGACTNQIFWRSRIKRAKLQQYEKTDDAKEFFTVVEHGVQFRVNLVDYLDTGLFLDHRQMRQHVATYCSGKRLLNLFSYTASFSVHAAIHGATYTKSVDMSNTYTDWAKENFLLNNLSLKNNEVIRADCMPFLHDEVRSKNKYDVIVIDPPTISRSKKMQQMFDVQVDYVFLLEKALELLQKNGHIFFSTNLRSFILDSSLLPPCKIEEITEKTRALDFHDAKIHKAYLITP